MRVVIIGARGIGKQHAKWFHREGAEVVAFAGNKPDLLPHTERALQSLFPFTGRGYSNLEEMFANESPEIAVVSSPHAHHVDHALIALRHGAHVYLEKPFVWDKSRSHSEMQEAANTVLAVADRAGRLVGINTQYAGAWEAYQDFFGPEAPTLAQASRLFVEMESRNLGSARHYEDIWIDLASHPISMMLKVRPGGRVVEDTACMDIGARATQARFEFAAEPGRPLSAEFHCRSVSEGVPRRRFGLDGVLVDYEGRNDDSGTFRAVLRAGNREEQFPDFMHESIRKFLEGVRTGVASHLVASGAEGARNLEIHLHLTALARQVA